MIVKMLKRNRFKFLILLIFGSLAFYYQCWGQFIKFTEEVELSSGEIIIIQRKLKTNSFGEVGGPGGWEVKFNSLIITNPSNSGNPSIWQTDEELLPILFDFDSKTREWFVVASAACGAWRAVGDPNDDYHYVEYRFKDRE
jgi:hypothetical protein